MILHGSGKGPVVTFSGGETRNSVLADVTVTGGATRFEDSAGGVLIIRASPTIEHVTVQANQGCGVAIFYGGPVVRNSSISKTTSTLTDPGCLPREALLPSVTGGIVLYGAAFDGLQTQVVNNTIENNQSVYVAGGIFIDAAGQPLIQNNIVRYNTSYGLGAGLSVRGDTSPVIVQNLIYENTINPILTNPALADSGAGINIVPDPYQGSGMPVLLVNNTIVGNKLLAVRGANTQGSQLFLEQRPGGIILSNNLVDGPAGQSAVLCSLNYLSPVSPQFDHNDIYAGFSDPSSGPCVEGATSGNISADPSFASGPNDAIPYSLARSSPAIDAGNNQAPYMTGTDFAGQPRIQNARNLATAVIDMGAYEYPGVPAPSFALSISPTTISIPKGSSGVALATLTPLSGSLGVVRLDCEGLPMGASCSFAPQQLELDDGMAHTVSVGVHFGSAQVSKLCLEKQQRVPLQAAAASFCSLLLMPLLRKRRCRTLLSLLAFIAVCLGAIGCQEIRVPYVVEPSTYQITVSATTTTGLTRHASLTLSVPQ